MTGGVHISKDERERARLISEYKFAVDLHEVEGWEKAVNSLRVKFNADIYEGIPALKVEDWLTAKL